MSSGMPMKELLNIETEKYQVARAAMRIINEITDFSVTKDNKITKPAIYALAKVLTGEITYTLAEKVKAPVPVEDENLV